MALELAPKLTFEIIALVCSMNLSHKDCHRNIFDKNNQIISKSTASHWEKLGETTSVNDCAVSGMIWSGVLDGFKTDNDYVLIKCEIKPPNEAY
jgi:hypothetical protein